MIHKMSVMIGLIFFGWLGIVAVRAQDSAPAERSIYIFGDSWAQQMSETGTPIPFDQTIIDNEFDDFVTLHKHAISGSTLDQWANDENGILTALADEISADSSQSPIVFFTLGGNDVFAGSSAEEMAADLTTILTTLSATRPDVEIVQGGYDILNPNISPAVCFPAMLAIFGSTDPSAINPIILAAYQDSVDVTATFTSTVSVNTFGSLQGSPGEPVISEWSPVQYLADCIHLNSDGYNIYLDTLFQEQITPELCSDPLVTAAVCSRIKLYLPLITR